MKLLLLQAKVKSVADAIWSKLSGVFSKEVVHAQHVSVFCHILQVTCALTRGCLCNRFHAT